MSLSRFTGVRVIIQGPIRDLVARGLTDSQVEAELRNQYGALYRKANLRDDFRRARDAVYREQAIAELGPDARIPPDLRIPDAGVGVARYTHVVRINGRRQVSGEEGPFIRRIISNRLLTKREAIADAIAAVTRGGRRGYDRIDVDSAELFAVLEA